MKKIILFICLLSIVFSALSPLKVLAIDVDFYSSNDILFYNPDDSGCGNSSGSSSGSSETGNAKENLEYILKYLTNKGFSLATAAGIAANIKYESGFEPSKIQGGKLADANYQPVDGVGFGLAQWTTQDRQKGLVKFAASENKTIIDLTMQVDHIWNTSKNASAMFTRLNAIKSETNVGQTTAPSAAAIIFHGTTTKIENDPIIKSVNPPRGYESSGSTAEGVLKRGKAAEKIYEDYKDTIKDGTGVPGTSAPDTYTDGTNCDNSNDAGEYGWDLTGPHAMVFYNQCSSEWANKLFGNGKLCECGCGPTSLAMIVATLTGDKSVNPANMATFYAANGGQASGCGSSWNWSVISNKYPVKVTDLGKDLNKAKDILRNGGLVIFSWTGAPFTGGGHIMVMRKFSPDGKIYIASSGGTTNSKQSEQAWEESIFINGYNGPAVSGRGSTGYLKGLWGVEKK